MKIMKLTVTYDELARFATARAHTKVEIQPVNESTICFKAPIGALLDLVKVKLVVEVIGMTGSTVSLRYKSALGVDKLIGLLLKFLRKRDPELANAMVFKPGNIVWLYLDRVERMKDLLKYCGLDSLKFLPLQIELQAHLNS